MNEWMNEWLYVFLDLLTTFVLFAMNAILMMYILGEANKHTDVKLKYIVM